MRIKIYRYANCITRSVLRASCIAEIDSDELPVSHDDLARQYGGDFFEIEDTQDE